MLEQLLAMAERSVSESDTERIISQIVMNLESSEGYTFHHYPRGSVDVVFVLDPQGNEITYGLGKGLSSKIGAYAECIQMLDNYQEENKENDNDLLNFVELRPKFKPIAFLQFGSFFQMEYYDDKNNISLQSVESQVQILVTNMSSLGYSPSQYVVDYGDFFIVCSYTPNLERFYNIRKTVSTLPLSFIQKHL